MVLPQYFLLFVITIPFDDVKKKEVNKGNVRILKLTI